jgi:hypothetical protein
MTQTFSSDVKKLAVKLNYTLVIMIYLGALFFSWAWAWIYSSLLNFNN